MKRTILLSAIVIAFVWPACASATIVYEVIDLGTLGGDQSWAFSINDAGQIVGSAEYTPGNRHRHATLFDPTGAGNNIDLGTLGGDYSQAISINDAGQIVGGAALLGDDRYHATMFDPTGAGNNIDLASSGRTYSFAYSINDAGRIVGGWHSIEGNPNTAVLFDSTGGRRQYRPGARAPAGAK